MHNFRCEYADFYTAIQGQTNFNATLNKKSILSSCGNKI